MSATWRMSVDLPAMFGPGDEPEARLAPSARRPSDDVVGDEAPGGGELLDDRVAAVLEHELERVVHLGPREVVAVRDLGERARDVPRGEARGDRAQPLGVRRRARARARAKSSASRAAARSSACAILSARSSSSSQVKRSPLAIVCLRRHSLRRLVDVRAGDLDVPAEDAGVAQLEARPMPGLAQRAPRARR